MDLSRIARGGTPIELDRLRVLFFDKQSTWLLVQRFGVNFISALYTGNPQKAELELKSMDALAFFLWAGLQAEAAENGEELTLERVEEFLVPLKLDRIFYAVVLALARGINTPPAPGESPGKTDAAAASPVADAEAKLGPGASKVSTMQTRSASPTPYSSKRRTSSGRPR